MRGLTGARAAVGAVLAGAGAAAIAGCGALASEEGRATPEPKVTLTTLGPEEPIDNAFAFMTTTLEGEPFDGLSIDDTDVVLWFWAPWCPTCQLQAATINEALPLMPDGVPLIGVAGLSDDLEYMQEFVDVTGVTGMTHLADLDGEVYRHFDITAQSTLVFIDDSGEASLLGAGATAEEIVAKAEGLAAR